MRYLDDDGDFEIEPQDQLKPQYYFSNPPKEEKFLFAKSDARLMKKMTIKSNLLQRKMLHAKHLFKPF